MSQFINFKFKKNIFFILFVTSFIFSILNSFYQISKFDNYKDTKLFNNYHSMINGDIQYFYNEGDTIASDIKNGKNYFETGGEYRRPYLPSRIFALYSLVFNEKLFNLEGKINTDNKKIIILILQSLLYYILLTILYKKIIKFLPIFTSKLSILFLALEPTIFMYHSSFWSESIFFSLQIFIIIFLIKKNFYFFDFFLLGIILGIFYLQRSVAIFYIIPVLLMLYLRNKGKIFQSITLVAFGYFLIHLLVGYHNYERSGIFYTTSTQAKDGFYHYLAPNILSKKLKIKPNEAYNILQTKKNSWAIKNNLNLDKEKDRLTLYSYQKNEAFMIILNNPIHSGKVIFKKTLHFLVIDPLTHVYYFHRWNNDNGFFYKSSEHKKWIVPRIVYSILIYFLSLLGVVAFYRNKTDRNFLLILLLSIAYFLVVQGWYGGTRYFAPILIYLSFLFSNGIFFLKKNLNL